MKEQKQKENQIPFTKSEWKGKEVDHRTDRVIVKLRVNPRKPDEEDIKRKTESILKSDQSLKLLRTSNNTGRLLFEVPAGTDVVQLTEKLSKLPDVKFAEPDLIGEIRFIPNDTRFSEQWALPMIDAEGAWDLERGTASVLIGITDTGISADDAGALTHPDLDDNTRYILGHDYINDDDLPKDDHGHGTHVCGTAAAESNNASGVTGLNWNSQVYICKIADSGGFSAQSDMADAIEEIVDYAVAHNLHAIISMSLRWTSATDTLRDACQYAHDQGMLLSIATGNDHGAVGFPASLSTTINGIIAVGATDSGDAVADFSNKGPEVTVVAPGVGILSTFPTYDVSGSSAHDFVSWDGTSMATPHVAGLASLVWSHVPQLTNEQVKDVIVNTAVKLGAGDFDDAWGHGRINASDAVAKAGWTITPTQINLQFIDIPEGETQLRAIRLDVNSFHTTSFEMSILPGAPFTMYNYTSPTTIGKTTDYDTPREVYLWVKYTGTTADDTANTTAQVRCITTNETFDVNITANTIARPTCAMVLVLDKSGSMLEQSGIGTLTREQVLRFSANIFMSYVRQNNGVGIVTFDQDAYDLLNPVAGPFGALGDPFDTARSTAVSALGGYAANPSGLTAIGDGIERAHNNLSSVSGYDKKAIIVFTDGFETASKYIADVSSLINEQVFAVGLGTADQLQPASLNNICNGHNGYLLLTDQLDNDDIFKLAKYFLQIQAGVNNEQVVVDPNGYVLPGHIERIPFDLNETDISADAIVMTPIQGLVEVAIETPDGNIIQPSNLTSFPTVDKVNGAQLCYYKMTLPVSDGASINAQTGRWNILLRTNDKYYRKYSSKQYDNNGYTGTNAHGIKYTALVHAYSNLRMKGTLSQTSYEPGGDIHLRCLISEYGVPLQKRSSGSASIQFPDGSSGNVVLSKTGTGVYETTIQANLPGIYKFVIHAKGLTSRNTAFTREQVLTCGVWKGGNNPVPSSTNDPGKNNTEEAICKLLHCISRNVNSDIQERWAKEGINLSQLSKCYCNGDC